jgi:hypothetical protein
VEVADVAWWPREILAYFVALAELIQAAGDDLGASLSDVLTGTAHPDMLGGALDSAGDRLSVGEPSVGLDTLGQVVEQGSPAADECLARLDPRAHARAWRRWWYNVCGGGGGTLTPL